MKSIVKSISVINLLFIVLFMLSGFFGGVIGEFLYCVSFVIPFLKLSIRRPSIRREIFSCSSRGLLSFPLSLRSVFSDTYLFL